MEYEVTQSTLGMLTTSLFLGIIGKVGKGCVKAWCHVSLVIRTYQQATILSVSSATFSGGSPTTVLALGGVQ